MTKQSAKITICLSLGTHHPNAKLDHTTLFCTMRRLYDESKKLFYLHFFGKLLTLIFTQTKLGLGHFKPCT